jgi:RNA polymerase sigma-70 factor (TIGR02957 family)
VGDSVCAYIEVMSIVATAHDELRPLMFSIAYRMLGSVAEAEDVVQEAFLRMHRYESDEGAPESPEAFATTVTTRIAIDTLRSARVRRESYVGPWLPEPVLDDDPAHQVERDETVSVAFLALLERLSPVERAVFLLREVFDYTYAEIATIVEKSEANCRQLFARARRHLDEGRPRFEPDEQRWNELAAGFFAAMEAGNVATLERLLAEDVVLYGDGGGKAPAIKQPMHGAMQAARFLAGIGQLSEQIDVHLRPTRANGRPAALAVDGNDRVVGVVTFDVHAGKITTVRSVINPDKLHHLGEVGDLTALIAAR